ncbi:MAG TPA: succinylglutamate desuccinylase/aspartoacylase family protein [Bacteroidia bacterium]|nr:succinylglutamate desuccinylase/aspartoacylase family protein [Bacteroidia bacterium]
MGKSFNIQGQTIGPGEHAQVVLNIYKLPTHTLIEIPVFVFNGKEAGPTILFLAGMHGDEINGIEVLRRLIRREDVKRLKRGCIVIIPVINIIAFLAGTRDLPDGRDLNRCFPGSPNGSLGSRIAHDLMQTIVPQIDFGIDFHTGGARISNYPQVRCVFDDPRNLELGKIFSPLMVLNSPFREYTLRKAAAGLGKPFLVFEGGESRRFDYESITEGLNGCMRILNHYGMTKAKVPQNPTVFLSKTTWIRARSSGLFHTQHKYGARVDRNETLGQICDPYGEVEHLVSAPFNGYIVGVNNQPVVNQGDALIHLGIEQEPNDRM